MYNAILVPIHLGHKDRFRPMLDVARKLAAENARIILLTVVEEIPSYIMSQLPADIATKSLESATEELKAVARQYDLRAELDVRSGNASRAILETAEEKGVDLIVIASHRPGWEDYLIGSTAARVVRHAECSVHVIR
jgi:universal stress protein F